MKIARLLPAAALMVATNAYGVSYAEKAAESSVPPSPPPGAHMEQGMNGGPMHSELLELLPDDKRKLLMDTMKKTHEGNIALFEQLHKLHEEREAILKADKFDQAAFLKKSDEIDALNDKFSKIHEKAVASVASQFNPEERRVLALLGRMMMGHHGFGHDGAMMMHHGEFRDGPPPARHGEPGSPG